MLAKKKPMSELAAPLKIYPQVLENVRVTDKKAAQNDPAVQEAVNKVAEALGDTGRICPSKQPQSLQKYSSKIRNTASSKPDHQYTNQTIIQPLIITHPEERIWAGRTPPAVAPGPGRSEDQARQDETILHG